MSSSDSGTAFDKVFMQDLRNALNGPNARDAIDRAAALAADNGGLQSAHSKIVDLQEERARAMSEGATADSRRIVAIDQQIASATAALRRLVEANLRVANERLISAQQNESSVRARYGDKLNAKPETKPTDASKRRSRSSGFLQARISPTRGGSKPRPERSSKYALINGSRSSLP